MAQFNQSQIIPDDVLLELQKITKLEQQTQDLSSQTQTLQQQMSQVNTILQENNLIKDDFSNVIDTKNKPKEALTAVEKKRFQIIGQEFIKGAEPFLKQIKKAEQLKQKMSTKVNPFTKKLKDFLKQGAQRLKSKVKSKFGGAMKKFGLAILAIGVVLYLFKDKIASIFENINIGEESPLGKLIDNTDKLLDQLEQKLTSGIGNILKFLVSDDLTASVKKFFDKLPQQIRNFGFQTLSELGADVNPYLEKTNKEIDKKNEMLEQQATSKSNEKNQVRQVKSALGSSDIQKVLKSKSAASQAFLNDETKQKFINVLKKSDYFISNSLKKQDLDKNGIDERLKTIFENQQETVRLLARLQESNVFEGEDEQKQKQKLVEFLNKNFGYDNNDDKKPFSITTFNNDPQFFNQLKNALDAFKSHSAAVDSRVDELRGKSQPIRREINVEKVEQITAQLGGSMLAEQVAKLDKAIDELTKNPSEILKHVGDYSKTVIETFLINAWENVWEVAKSLCSKFKIGNTIQNTANAIKQADKKNGERFSENKKRQVQVIKQVQASNKKNGGFFGGVFSQQQKVQIPQPLQLPPTVVINLQLNGQAFKFINGYSENLQKIIETLKASNENLDAAVVHIESFVKKRNSKPNNVQGVVAKSGETNIKKGEQIVEINPTYNQSIVLSDTSDKYIPSISDNQSLTEIQVLNHSTQSLTKLVEKSHTLQIVNHGDNTVGNKIENLRNYTENEFRVVNNTIGVCLKQIGNLKKGIIDLTPSGGISTAATILHQLHQ